MNPAPDIMPDSQTPSSNEPPHQRGEAFPASTDSTGAVSQDTTKLSVFIQPSVLIAMALLALLLWDLYPYLQWQLTKDQISSSVGRPVAEAQATLGNAGLRTEVYRFGGTSVLGVTTVRTSRSAGTVLWVYEKVADPVNVAQLSQRLFPYAVIELDTSDTLNIVQHMY